LLDSHLASSTCHSRRCSTGRSRRCTRAPPLQVCTGLHTIRAPGRQRGPRLDVSIVYMLGCRVDRAQWALLRCCRRVEMRGRHGWVIRTGRDGKSKNIKTHVWLMGCR
jgi:hypothetical protein